MEKKSFNKEKFIFYSIFVIMSIGLLFFFHWFTLNSSGDYTVHFNKIMTDSKNSYSLINIFIGLFSPIGNTFCLWMYVILLVIFKMSVIIITRIYLKRKVKDQENTNDLVINLISYFVGIFFVWHNPTIIFLQPLVLLSCIYIEKIVIENKLSIRNVILLTIFNTIANAIKPSYFFGIVPALAIVFIIWIIKEKGKNLKNILWVSISFVPSLIVLIFQFQVLFPSTSESSFVSLGLFNIRDLFAYITLVVPAIIYFICRHLTKADWMIIAFCIVGFLEGSFIIENGKRREDGNFKWSFISAINIALVFAGLNYIKNKNYISKTKRRICIIIFILGYVISIGYFISILARKGGYSF